MNFFEDVKFLTSFIGCNIFEIIETKEQQDLRLFYTIGRGCNAKGYYNTSSFTVLKDRRLKRLRSFIKLESEKRLYLNTKIVYQSNHSIIKKRMVQIIIWI